MSGVQSNSDFKKPLTGVRADSKFMVYVTVYECIDKGRKEIPALFTKLLEKVEFYECL